METLTEIFDEDAVWHVPGAQLTGRRLPGPRRDGKHQDVDVCLVFQLKDGRVTEGWEHYRDLYA